MSNIKIFENKKVRSHYDSEKEVCYFSVIDIIDILTESKDPTAYWRKLKQQSIPSPKAEPFKQWLAKVGYERLQEIQDPALSMDRARENWQKMGRSEKWIQQRMTG